ncbi:MAG: hypothetical protein GF403_02580 [Candidatus Coatesbacteria bacterium]|nr:hypothetical protein [Candidatus Coatesbacteria bacterium]
MDLLVKTADWLMKGPAFIRYRTLKDLLPEALGVDVGIDDEDALREEAAAEPLVAGLIDEVNAWEDQPPLKNHNNAAHPLHKLVFLAETGVDAVRLTPAVEAVMNHQSPEGPFQVRSILPKAFGGDGVERWTWFATDAPLTSYALVKLGLGDDERVRKSVDYLLSRQEDYGSPCYADPNHGPEFKGPGRRGEPCPYASLITLRLFSVIPELRESAAADRLIECLLNHWSERGTGRKYYLFGIGGTFLKPKAPRIWYDIVHFADVLSRFPRCRYEPAFTEIIAALRGLLDDEGRVTPGSVWLKWNPDGRSSKAPKRNQDFPRGQPVGRDERNWSGWEFVQKRKPSRWLTYLVWMILKPAGAA